MIELTAFSVCICVYCGLGCSLGGCADCLPVNSCEAVCVLEFVVVVSLFSGELHISLQSLLKFGPGQLDGACQRVCPRAC